MSLCEGTSSSYEQICHNLVLNHYSYSYLDN
jgi:hypothetical protein